MGFIKSVGRSGIRGVTGNANVKGAKNGAIAGGIAGALTGIPGGAEFGAATGGLIGGTKFGSIGSAVDGPKAKQYSVPGKPADPTFGSAVKNGQLSDLYKVKARTASMGQAGQELRNRALATGPSAWAQLQTQQQGLEQQNAMNAAAQQTAGANAQAQAGLAMRGGLGSGSRERLAASSAWNQLAAGQGVRNQGMQNRLGINIADQEQKNAMLGTSAGMETDLSKFNVGQVNTAAGMNAQTAFNNLQGQNQFNTTLYGQKMADRGATMNANAMLEANQPRSTFWKINDPFQLSGK